MASPRIRPQIRRARTASNGVALRSKLIKWVAACCLTPAMAYAQTDAADGPAAMLPYQLVDSVSLPSLNNAPSVTAWRLIGSAHWGQGQQLRLSTTGALGVGGNSSALYSSQPLLGGLEPVLHLASNSESLRATYRFTVLTQANWAWRVGVTTSVNDVASALLPSSTAERPRLGAWPLLHVAGEHRVAARWLLGVDADGLMTPRGHALELDLRVNYQLAPNFALYGGYHLTNSTNESDDPLGSNAASVGLRLRF